MTLLQSLIQVIVKGCLVLIFKGDPIFIFKGGGFFNPRTYKQTHARNFRQVSDVQFFQFCIFSNPLILLANWSLKCLTTWQVVNCQMVHRGSLRYQPRLLLIYRNSIR